MSKPIVEQLQCTHRILRYASGTTYHGLLYRAGIAEQLVYYTEVDWARNVDDHQSTFGYAFSLGSATITWCIKKQSTVALSNTEANYTRATIITCEAIWLKRLLQDPHVEVDDLMPIYCHNLNTQIAKNLVFHAHTKYIKVYYHFVCERVLSSEVELRYVQNNWHVADIFTKELELNKLRQFSEMLGL